MHSNIYLFSSFIKKKLGFYTNEFHSDCLNKLRTTTRLDNSFISDNKTFSHIASLMLQLQPHTQLSWLTGLQLIAIDTYN